VREFADVFPEELPEMPPERELEFTIDLKQRTEPIARMPYQMSTPELQGLKMQLKELLTTTPILKVLDRDADFLVCIDASKEGLGRVLMQDRHVIAYILKKLRRHEENYAMHDLELLAIVYALKVWRHYLVGKKFELKTDHCGL
jgi:hypothetical protein